MGRRFRREVDDGVRLLQLEQPAQCVLHFFRGRQSVDIFGTDGRNIADCSLKQPSALVMTLPDSTHAEWRDGGELVLDAPVLISMKWTVQQFVRFVLDFDGHTPRGVGRFRTANNATHSGAPVAAEPAEMPAAMRAMLLSACVDWL